MSCMLFVACSKQTATSTVHTESYQSYFSNVEQYQVFFESMHAKPVINEKVAAVIAPHHLLVGKSMAELYTALSSQNPSVVVIIGPDHDGVANKQVVTTTVGYSTPYGLLESNKAIAMELSTVPMIGIDTNAFVYEHSINSHTAMIKKVFKNASIVPLMIQGTVTLDEAEALARKLHNTLPDDALVIASVDFSHYLPQYIANFHDKAAIGALETYDIDFIPQLEVDSPASLASVLMYTKMRNAQNVVYKDHTNSAMFSDNTNTTETTSHVYMAFGKGKPRNDSVVNMLFYGDSIFGRGIETIAEKKGVDYMLGKIAHTNERFFLGSHLTAINIEGPITDSKSTGSNPIILKSNPAIAKEIVNFMQIDLLSFNNNHTYDALENGVKDTVTFAKKNNKSITIPEAPCEEFLFQYANVALCSFDDSRSAIDTQKTKEIVQNYKAQNDAVIIFIHWGQEYRDTPSSREMDIGKNLIDAGADAIIGHGPHVVQPLEWYKQKPIVYSIGNFLFDQLESPMNTGVVLGLSMRNNVISIHPFPFKNTNGSLHFLDALQREKFMEQYYANLQ